MNAYIVISIPPRTSTEEESGWIANLAIGALRLIVPAANPELEQLYDRVTIWHVETDASTGEPLREVGLDGTGNVVVLGPWHDNYGVIVDSNVTFNPSEYQHVSAEQFEQEWNSLRRGSP